MIVGGQYEQPMGMEARNPVRILASEGQDHNWIQVGFRTESNSDYGEWINFDPWWDSLYCLNPNGCPWPYQDDLQNINIFPLNE